MPPRSGIRLFSSLGAAALGAVGVYLALRTWSTSGPPAADQRPPRPPRPEPPEVTLPGRSPARRLLFLLVLIAALAAGGFFAYRAWFAKDGATVESFTTVAATTTTLRAEIATSGVAEAMDETALTFPFAGRVGEILVELGDDVTEGQPLARLETDDLETAVETAETNVALARIRLRQLLKGADASDVAAAEDAVASAATLYNKGSNDLADLLDGPSAAEVAAAENSVETAEASLEAARNRLEKLTAPPSAAEISTANKAIEAARSSFEKAKADLDKLLAGPSAAELAAAEQKLEAAEASLETAKSNLDELTSGASSAAVAAAEASVASAQANLDAAENLEQSAEMNLQAAESGLQNILSSYCADPDAAPAPCTPQDVPLSSSEVDAVIASSCVSIGDTDCVPALTVTALVIANTAYQSAENSLHSAQGAIDVAQAALDAAEEQLAALGAPADASQVAAAEAAVDAAEAGVEAAQAALDELKAGADPQDIAVARSAVDAAEASLLSALDGLTELLEPPDPTELAAERAAVSSAEQALEAAQLARDEVVAGPTDRDIDNAVSALESAATSLDAARERRNKVLSGAEAEDIELQQEQVRLAEIALKEVKKALSDATLVAPFDGSVAALSIRVGELVGPTAPALTMLTPGALRVALTVGETELPEIKVGQRGGIQFDAIQERPFLFEITGIGLAPQVQQGVVTYDVRAPLTVGDDIPPDQRPAPGMNGAAVIVTEQKTDVLAVPGRAIRRRGDDLIVEILVAGEIEQRVVETGLTDGENTEIVSGLEVGDEVVLRGGTAEGEGAEETPESLPEGIR